MPENNFLNARQIMFLSILFLFGSSIIIGVNINADIVQDSWIALILSFLFNIPYIFVIVRITSKFPQKNIYEIFDIVFGKILGKILGIIFSIYTLYLASIILRNYTEYIQITTLIETPQLITMILIILIIIYIGKSRISVLGRWTNVVLVIFLSSIIATILLSLPLLDFKKIQPIFEHSIREIMPFAYKIFMLPFSELIVILGMADLFKLNKKENKTFFLSITIVGIILLLIILRNNLILGYPFLKTIFFPSYQTARVLGIDDYLTRLEGIVTINSLLAGITKLTVFIISLAKGLNHLTKNNDYKVLIFPAGLLILMLCPYTFENVVDMFSFAPIFGKYAMIPQVFIPIVTWIFIETKFKNKIQ